MRLWNDFFENRFDFPKEFSFESFTIEKQGIIDFSRSSYDAVSDSEVAILRERKDSSGSILSRYAAFLFIYIIKLHSLL